MGGVGAEKCDLILFRHNGSSPYLYQVGVPEQVDESNVPQPHARRSVFRPQLRKQNHIANTRAIGKKHDEPVDPDSFAGCGWQAVL
jgi:hypothetical protein